MEKTDGGMARDWVAEDGSAWEAMPADPGNPEGDVRFWPQGGGFSRLADREAFERGFSPREAAPEWAPSMADADWMDAPVKCHSDGRAWNGWGMPMFGRGEADAIAATIPGMAYDAEADAFTMPADYDDEPPKVWAGTDIVSGGKPVRAYPIGGGEWCWEPCPAPTPPGLADAIRNGDALAVETILKERPAMASSVDPEGRTPMHLAADGATGPRAGDCVFLLAAAGARPDARDAMGRTPLLAAAMAGRTDSLGILIDAGADPCIHDAEGRTPLHAVAGQPGSPERGMAIGRLISAGANPDARDAAGRNCLHALSPDSKAGFDPGTFGRDAQALAAAGADPSARDSLGRTPAMAVRDGAGQGCTSAAWMLDGIAGTAAKPAETPQKGKAPGA